MTTNYGSNIQRLPANALDPDRLEQQFAAQLHGPEGAYQLPFLQAAMYDRQRRGDQLSSMNNRANDQAYALAQAGLGLEERGQLRDLAGRTYEHGMPIAPTLLVPGGMPTDAEVRPLANIGNQVGVQNAVAQAAQRYGSAAQAANEGGIVPTTLPGMSGMTMRTPNDQVVAGINASSSGRNEGRLEANTDPQGGTTYRQRLPAGATPADAAAVAEEHQEAQRLTTARRAGRQALERNPRLQGPVNRELQAIQQSGGTGTVTADANTVIVTGRHPSGRQRVVRFNRATGEPVQ